ncbi:MAG TPA: LCP family protein [Kineosporiaceae bacterium]|nr:LCP family protein [Kineosporiaceae bacterium]
MSDRTVSTAGTRRRGWLIAGAVLATFLVTGGIIAGWMVGHLRGNITATDITDRLGTDRPAPLPAASDAERTPLNVLVLGSDSRLGANGFVGGTKDVGRSDTTMLLHLPADRSSALAVSIPRDSMVRMPDCVTPDGSSHPGGLRMFNEAYTIGGAACTVRTVEQLTRIRIDHYMVIDFAGFKAMVDALGSVEICLPEAINDRRHGISLPAGRSRVSGDQALSYVRERYALGDGGDLGRIGRQQAFLSSVLQQATSTGTLTNPLRLYGFLDAATRSMTTDPQLADLTTLVGLAREVHAIGLHNIRFLTVPNGTYPADVNRLEWTPAADDLWRAIREDRPISVDGGAPDPTPAGPGTATSGGPVQVAGASAVKVRVLNGAGRSGVALTAAGQLRAAGFTVTGTGSAAHTDGTVLRYGPGQLEQARLLASVLPFAQLHEDPALGSTIVVVAGPDWSPPVDPAAGAGGGTPTPSASRPVQVDGAQLRTAAASICPA